MTKFLSLIFGLTLGAAVGVAVVALFAPVSGDELVRRLKQGYAEALDAARQASADRRAELEAQLAELQQRRSS